MPDNESGRALRARIIVEGPGGVIVGEGPPGGGGLIVPRCTTAAKSNDLARIHDVDGLGGGDADVLAEIAEVLQRHGVQERFGVTLLHSHFDMEDDEVLVERVDTDKRCLSIASEPLDQFEADELVPTSWRFVGQRVVPCSTATDLAAANSTCADPSGGAPLAGGGCGLSRETALRLAAAGTDAVIARGSLFERP